MMKNTTLPLDSANEFFEQVQRNSLFDGITSEEIEALLPRLVFRRFHKGEIVLSMEDSGSGMFLLVEGIVRVSRKNIRGLMVDIAEVRPGEFFGDLELIDGRGRSAQVTALSDGAVFELLYDDCKELLRTNHPFMQKMLEVVSIRLRSLNDQYIRELDVQYEVSQTEIKKLQRIIEASKNVNSTLHLDRLLEIILETAQEIASADRGTLYIIDRKRNEICSKTMIGGQWMEIRLPIGKGIAGFVAEHGESVNISEAYNDPRFNSEIDGKSGYVTHSILCIPMKDHQGKVIGVLQLLNNMKGAFSKDDAEGIEALSSHAAIAIENARLYEQERQKIALEHEVNAARNVQQSLLPQSPPAIKGYDIAGVSISAKAVSGDYFDYISLSENKTAICIGDVSGKGLPAALLMANLQAILRSQILMRSNPKRTLVRTNALLYQSTASDKFVTLFYSILDAQEHTLTYANAGHEFPLLFRKFGTTEYLKTGGLILSIMDRPPYEEETLYLDPGDMVMMYSDGISEAMNSAQEPFGLERLEEVIRLHRNDAADSIKQAVIDAVQTHVGSASQHDDITLVIIKRN